MGISFLFHMFQVWQRTVCTCLRVGTLVLKTANHGAMRKRKMVNFVQVDSNSLGTASYRRAVKQLLKSVVREICTLRSVGAGALQTITKKPLTAHDALCDRPASLANASQCRGCGQRRPERMRAA
jgi:hypothetical protein